MIQTYESTDVVPAEAHFQTEFDRDVPDSITSAVLEAVATCARKDVLDLDPLTEAIDADALNDLFRSRSDGSQRSALTVEFSYQGYLVVVESDGFVRVTAE